jgi:hypothetical protein
MLQSETNWARDTFGGAQLGDRRRVERLVAVAARVACRPKGTVTAALQTSAEQEGAFRLLESEAVSATMLQRAAFDSTARSCEKARLIYVPVDQTSLNLSDRAERRELGRVGTDEYGARGLQVMTALAVDDGGDVVGVLEQRWWARGEKKRVRDAKQAQCINGRHLKRETRFWLETIQASEDRLAENGGTKAWYQMDRGADCWPLFEKAIEQDLLVTVRAVHNRRAWAAGAPRGERRYLKQELERQRVLSRYEVLVPRKGKRPRTAQIALRACTVTISALVGKNRRQTFEMNAVMARETQRRPDRICWVLLTTHPIAKRADVEAVVAGYSLRWRIEDFHRAWKRGHCNVESSQLHSRGALVKWATILATVAARAQRLAHLFRSSPELPASTEFTEYEIDACYILTKTKRDRRKTLTVGDVLRIVAELGGFGARYYGGKMPGPTVLGRGLDYLEPMARGLRNMEQMR